MDQRATQMHRTTLSAAPTKAKALPNTTTLLLSILGAFTAYIAFGATGIYYLKVGGGNWGGNTGTLTSILAVMGVIFTVLSRFLISTCQSAATQHLSRQSMISAIPLRRLHKNDVAVRGGLWDSVSKTGCRGPIYRFGLPIIGILIGAMFKKAFTVEILAVEKSVTGSDASYVDPVNITSHIRGTSFAGPIAYNTTAGIGSGRSYSRTAWTYIAATRSDVTGVKVVEYALPALPNLVADGNVGYTDYTAESASALVTNATCSSDPINSVGFIGSIENTGAYNISLVYDSVNYSAVVEVTTPTTTWSCLADLGQSNGTTYYKSDGNGNWITSSFDRTGKLQDIIFFTTLARGRMMADIISDALATTAAYSGWNWETSDKSHSNYSTMLASTRLGFAITVLAYSETRMTINENGAQGTANQPVEKIVLKNNWALIVTTALLCLHALAAFYHLWGLGNFRLDYGLLQTIAMASSNEGTLAILEGHSAGLRGDLNDPRGMLEVRSVPSAATGANFRHLRFRITSTKTNEDPSWSRVSCDPKNQRYA